MKTKEEILSEITGIPVYRIQADDGGEYITKKGALLAMEEYRSQCDELPGDDAVNKQAKVSCKGNSHAMRYHHMLEQFREGAKWMRSLASPAIASRDARIRELEEEKRRLQFIIDNGLGERDLTNDL
jgi:hypothetical protein